MQIPLLTDIRKDKSFRKNLFRTGLFLVLVFTLDYLVSAVLLMGIERNYGLKSDADILLVGHSHLMLAIDNTKLEQFTGRKVAKYTREGVNVADRQIMLKHYFSVCKKKPELVVLSIDPWLFSGEGLSKNSYMLFYPFMDTPEVDKYISASVTNRWDYYIHRYFRCSRFDVSLLNSSLRGYMSNWSNLKFGVLDTMKLKNEISGGSYRRITFDQRNISCFAQILEYLEEQKIKVILLNTPVYKALTEVQPDAYKKALQIIEKQAGKHSNTTFIDLSPEFKEHSAYFFDPIHMNPEGQVEVTKAFFIRMGEKVSILQKVKSEKQIHK